MVEFGLGQLCGFGGGRRGVVVRGSHSTRIGMYVSAYVAAPYKSVWDSTKLTLSVWPLQREATLVG